MYVIYVCITAARNHVNRMCLAADVPLIESGTAGYMGQVTVMKKVGFRVYLHFAFRSHQYTYYSCKPIYKYTYESTMDLEL